jgi:hypothetical protein
MGHLVPTRTTTQLVSLALITNVLGTRNGEEEKAIQATRTQMNTNVSLSQATKSLECVWDLEKI